MGRTSLLGLTVERVQPIMKRKTYLDRASHAVVILQQLLYILVSGSRKIGPEAQLGYALKMHAR